MATYSSFPVTISQVGGVLFSGEVTHITLPSVDGVVTILAHHEPLIALLKQGDVTVHLTDGETKNFSIQTGVLEVSHNRAIVLV